MGGWMANSRQSTARRMRTAKQFIESFGTSCPVKVPDVDAQLAMKVPVERRRQISEPLFSHGVNNRTETDAGGDQTRANLRMADDTVEIEGCETFHDDDEMKTCQFTRTLSLLRVTLSLLHELA
jgi:hypothetical protein